MIDLNNITFNIGTMWKMMIIDAALGYLLKALNGKGKAANSIREFILEEKTQNTMTQIIAIYNKLVDELDDKED